MTSTKLRAQTPRVTWTAIGAALLAAAAAITSWAQADKPKAGAARPALSVSIVTPQPATLQRRIQAGGTLAAWQEASIGAEANGWRLAEVLVNVGDKVKRGQVLARFTAEMAQAELAQTQAALAEAQAALAEGRANAQRARDLQQTGALSQQQIDQFLTAERAAMARVQAHEATLRMQQIRLTHTRVLASDDGVISARTATVGAVVPAGQELFRLIRGSRLEWRAEVAATDLAQLKPGQTVQVAPDGGRAVTGKLRMIAPTVDTASRNALVYVDLPRDAMATAGARAGMYARGEFEIGASTALTLPQSAVLLRDGFARVFVVDANAKVAQVKVGTGQRDRDRIEITAGLEPGAKVVAAGGAFLADGDLVKVVATGAPKP